MRLTIDAATLAREVKHALTCVSEKGGIPVLSHVLITAERNRVTVAGTDLDIALRSVLDAHVEEDGRAAVPGKKLADVLSSLDGTISIEAAKDKHIEIRGGKARIQIAILPSADFPELPNVEAAAMAEIPGPELADLIAKTLPTCETDDKERRYYLTAGLLVVDEHQAAMVATDGHRMGYAVFAFSDPAKLPGGRTLVNRKGLATLQRIADDSTVRVSSTDRFLRFDCGDRTLHVKTVEGTFPQFEKMVRHESRKSINIDVEPLAAAVKRVALLSTTDSKAVRLDVRPGSIALACKSTDIGNADDALPVEYSGDEISIGLNGRYILDFLAVCGAKRVTLGLSHGDTFAVFSAGPNLRHLVMPMRL